MNYELDTNGGLFDLKQGQVFRPIEFQAGETGTTDSSDLARRAMNREMVKLHALDTNRRAASLFMSRQKESVKRRKK